MELSLEINSSEFLTADDKFSRVVDKLFFPSVFKTLLTPEKSESALERLSNFCCRGAIC